MFRNFRIKQLRIMIVLNILFFILLLLPITSFAYVGPGAGFAFVSTFFVFIATFFLVILSLLFWPLRFIYRLITGKLRNKMNVIDKMVIIGFDGMEPKLAKKWMKEGKLPNLYKLAKEGSFNSLRTTIPSISPVAWSTFSTGVNPGKHNIYDFLSRNVKTYLPDLSSARIVESNRSIKIGPYNIPIGKPEIRLLRKSKPFWKILGDNGFFSHIIRVPITFPPEKFNGLSLSAMCVPDLRGTQGTFTYYTSEKTERKHTGGVRIPVDVEGNEIKTVLTGPENSLLVKSSEMKIPFTVKIWEDKKGANLEIGDKIVHLPLNVYSDWINIEFKPALWIKVHGICRFLIKEVHPEFKMYVTPINIDPEKPALPISHPFIYSVYLAKMLEPFATLGLAEDTWALNEEVINDDDFLEQCYRHHNEREKMFFNALDKTNKGVCACVFDTTDRVQHMFFRYLVDDHPALRGKDHSLHKNAIEDVYKTCDKLVGKVLAKLKPNDVLMILSDHGFQSFARGINLNNWFRDEGFLFLKDEEKGVSGEWFENVDWTRTKAYNLGLGGVYLNMVGREIQGIVTKNEAVSLKKELITKLEALIDPLNGKRGITRVFDTAEVYSGPYTDNAPDLIIGYANGYRASWDGVTGIIGKDVFSDNTKAWSGDHCVNPLAVPGVLFSNKKIDTDKPHIADLAPTTLKLFGIDIPSYMDGKPLFDEANMNIFKHDETAK